jgi:stage II sporulation protein AA (anti-sigma F factor antagonist)
MAAVRCKYVRQTMTAYLEGEIDHHSAQSLREEIDAQILSMTPVKLVLDFGGVTFTDSSGIGLILGRNTMMKVLGGKMAIQNPPVQMVRILRLAQIPVEIMQEVTMR